MLCLINRLSRAFVHQLTYDVSEASHDVSSRCHHRRIGRELLALGMPGVCAANAPLNSFEGSMAHLRCQAVFPAYSKDR